MAKYFVRNIDSPIESDYWVDIPVRDPSTNKDQVDEADNFYTRLADNTTVY